MRYALLLVLLLAVAFAGDAQDGYGYVPITYTTATLPPCGTGQTDRVVVDITLRLFAKCDGAGNWVYAQAYRSVYDDVGLLTQRPSIKFFGTGVTCVDNGGTDSTDCTITSGSGAPTTATYITQTADAGLSAEQALGLLATGILKSTTTTGVLSIATAGTDYAAASHAHVKSEVGLGNADNTSDASKPVSTATQTALDLKANLASPTFTGTVTLPAATVTLAQQANMATASLVYRKTAGAGAPEVNTLATLKTDLTLVKGDVGLGSVDNTSDASKPVSTAQQSALDLKAPLASPTFTGTVVLPAATVTLAMQANMATSSLVYRKTAGSGVPEVNTLATLKTDLALVKGDVGLGSVDNTADSAKPISTATSTAINAATSVYRTLMHVSGSHTAARVAGTYALGQGVVAAISGTGTLYPIATIYIAAADYPTVNGLAPKLRIRAQLYTNDVAPTGNYTFGLYPITRPATSGGAGLAIYTIGTVVSGSNGATFTTPAADGLLNAVGADFALPADGHYIIAVVTTATVATSAHVHMTAMLQLHNL